MMNTLLSCISLIFSLGHAEGDVFEQKLVWSDEFNDSGVPDSTKWSFDIGDGCPSLCGWGNEELQYYTNRPQNVKVENGSLIIEAHREDYGGRAYTSAKLVTRGKADWKYCHIEVRAKLPKGRGVWPAIWMLSAQNRYGGWPASGEIDIMEHVGYDPAFVYGSVHTEAYNHVYGTQRTAGFMEMQNPFSEDFHIYAIDWTEEYIEFFVDDIPFMRFENEHNSYKEWPFDQSFYLILNIAVGGTWGGAEGVDDSIWPQRMEIDYVRVYQ